MTSPRLIVPSDPDSLPSQWSEFERTVALLLALSGYEVTAELLLGSKKVDIFATVPHFGKTRRYAVECKAHSRPLTRSAVVRIETDYQALRDQNLIDELLLVTREGVAPAALARIRESRFLHHQTLDNLRFSIIDFRSYLNDLQLSYREEGLHRYYVPVRGGAGDNHTDLEQSCLWWIADSDAPPLALLGSYGTGKTTFLLHLANLLVERFRSGQCPRMPIYIPLHELCSEQSLEGLLGRHFTGLHQVPRYSFGTFRHLNDLDGFDEMKHAMTTAEFRFTFQEVLRLVGPKGKTILSGRPTAFLAPSEREEFLHASLTHKDRIHRIQNRPDFSEIHLAPFTVDQIREFAEKYRRYIADLPAGLASRRIPTAEEFFRSKNITELARRPIQLRMLFDVLPAYEKDPDQLTVRELYTFFVALLLEREGRKPSRRRFTGDERKAFHERLGFYMWQRGISSISIDSIPEECVPESVQISEMHDAVRDLLSGSLLEIKYPGQLYFPHRSIQEFLVSEYLLAYFRGEDRASRLVPSLSAPPDFGFIENHISPEVVEFMIAASGRAERKGALDLLAQARSAVSQKSLRLWFESQQAMRELVDYAGGGNEWALALLVFARQQGWKPELALQGSLFHAGRQLILGVVDRDSCYRGLLLNWMLCSLEQDVREGHSQLQKACVALLGVTEERAVTRSGVEVRGRLRPPYMYNLLEQLSSDPTASTSTTEKEKRQWERTPKLYMLGSKRTLFAAASGLLDVFGWRQADRRGLRLIDTVEVDEELKRLLLERYDEDQLNPKKWERS